MKPPLPEDPPQFRGVTELFNYLQELILTGALPAGERLSQVKLAEHLSVSRTKLREALRMLQNDGLIEAEDFKRARVAPLDPQEIDALYSGRILNEVLAARLTVPTLGSMGKDLIRHHYTEMNRFDPRSDFESWESHHQAFHISFLVAASPPLQDTIRNYVQKTARFRRRYVEILLAHGSSASAAARAHSTLVDAAMRNDLALVVETLALHYARTVVVMMQQTGHTNARCTRAALEMVGVAQWPPAPD